MLAELQPQHCWSVNDTQQQQLTADAELGIGQDLLSLRPAAIKVVAAGRLIYWWLMRQATCTLQGMCYPTDAAAA